MNKPFSKMLFAVGNANAPMALIMPKRIAATAEKAALVKTNVVLI
jgi:hypothetical protein